MNTVTEKMQLSYLVIADYPSNSFDIGHIIRIHSDVNSVTKQQIAFYDKYPHLFRRLELEEQLREQKPDEATEIIKELVRLKVIRDKESFPHVMDIEDYRQSKPKAWEAAFAYLGQFPDLKPQDSSNISQNQPKREEQPEAKIHIEQKVSPEKLAERIAKKHVGNVYWNHWATWQQQAVIKAMLEFVTFEESKPEELNKPNEEGFIGSY